MLKYVLLLLGLCSFVIIHAQPQKSADHHCVHFSAGANPDDYLPKTIIFRLKARYRPYCHHDSIALQSLNALFEQWDVRKVSRKFPPSQHASRKKYLPDQEDDNKHIDLSMIYEIRYQGNTQLKHALNALCRTGTIVYAQPHYVQHYFYQPDDPASDTGAEQYYLDNVQAYEAWNIEKGDSGVVVGVIDSGIDTDHPDLADNIHTNEDDPVDGIDNDGDGYVDNHEGWDLVGADYQNPSPDNDPSVTDDNNMHGVHVSGISSAVTDNSTGIAGVGFNCPVMPVKASADNDYRASDSLALIMRGYEGIVYAADAGADIINCSWGGSASGQYEQEVVDYATKDRNCLIVVSAGNAGNDDIYYPAYFKNTLAVAATDEDDIATDFTNYGGHVDISAPGYQIYSTHFDDTYTSFSGTSMSAPVVAGGAALIRSHYPGYSPAQIKYLMRATADDIYHLDSNNTEKLKGKLGAGRLNLYRALSAQTPAIEMVDHELDKINPVGGDTVALSGTFTNLLQATSDSLLISMRFSHPDARILDSTFYPGMMEQGDTVNNQSNPFRFVLDSGIAADTISIKITFSDASSGYEDFAFIAAGVNRNYINIEKNQIATTLTNIGRTGYFGDNAAAGQGFVFDATNLLYETGLMIATGSGQLSNTVRPAVVDNNTAWDQDFYALSTIQLADDQSAADFTYQTVFHDSLAGNDRVGVKVKQQTYVWTEAPDHKYIIQEYHIQNQRNDELENLYAGLYSDWDIPVANRNQVSWDAQRGLGYVNNVYGEAPYAAGVRVLNSQDYAFYAIDNDDTEPALGVYDGFTDEEKRSALSSGVDRTSAGGSDGNDVSMVNGAGPYTLAPGETVHVAFAIMADSTLAGLQQSADEAYDKYSAVISSVQNNDAGAAAFSVYPNPVQAGSKVHYDVPHHDNSMMNGDMLILNASGQTLMRKPLQKASGTVSFGHLEPGLYMLKITSDNRVYTSKLMITP